jgi:RNA polymerase sigma factor (sigma-70 family)
MNTTDIHDILNDEKAWLESHPSMQPWDEGCRRVVTLLEDCLRRYSKMVRERAVGAADVDRSVYLARLWECLGYHWRDALAFSPSDGQISASQVAEWIAAGRGYRRGGQLGGDPLRDMVLAVAMVGKDQRTPRVFEEDYHAFACGLAAKIHRQLAVDPDCWWNDLLDHLAGYSGGAARLDRFSGRCALRNWLGTVVWNFLRRWRLASGESPEIDDIPGPSPLPNESLDHFAEIVRLAVATLSPRERLMLALVYVDGLKKNEAAAMLGLHPAQVTRSLEKALPRLENAIREIAATRLNKEACTGVFEDLRGNPPMFAARLREALEEGREQP